MCRIARWLPTALGPYRWVPDLEKNVGLPGLAASVAETGGRQTSGIRARTYERPAHMQFRPPRHVTRTREARQHGSVRSAKTLMPERLRLLFGTAADAEPTRNPDLDYQIGAPRRGKHPYLTAAPCA